jgi:hypothetical protein
MRRLPALVMIALPAAAAAQLLPVPPVAPQLPALPAIGETVAKTTDALAGLPRAVAALASDRLARIDALIRDHPADIARDDHGDPARAGDVIVADPDDALVAAASKAGFALAERATIPGVDIGYARFTAPAGWALPRAIKAMRKLAGNHAVSADQLHFQSGGIVRRAASVVPPMPADASGVRLGMIDGGVSNSAGIAGEITRAGFARGAGGGSNHGSAIASLLLGTPRIRGAAAGAGLWAADVYGTDPAGGDALAIARALGWLTAERVSVTVISLVGPANPLLARVVAAAQAKGMMIVAAVGNDGPAAPPAYPASYPGVIAVTGVDARGRALIEAGRPTHLDYAAPGADLLASDAAGRAVAVRGTSFAAPFVAARLVRHQSATPAAPRAALLRALDAEARDLGKRGPDAIYGRGLICGDCATVAR